ncbi:MAG: hypothetical protein ACXVUE_08115 [Solirubrobacteraceae bacterium]
MTPTVQRVLVIDDEPQRRAVWGGLIAEPGIGYRLSSPREVGG